MTLSSPISPSCDKMVLSTRSASILIGVDLDGALQSGHLKNIRPVLNELLLRQDKWGGDGRVRQRLIRTLNTHLGCVPARISPTKWKTIARELGETFQFHPHHKLCQLWIEAYPQAQTLLGTDLSFFGHLFPMLAETLPDTAHQVMNTISEPARQDVFAHMPAWRDIYMGQQSVLGITIPKRNFSAILACASEFCPQYIVDGLVEHIQHLAQLKHMKTEILRMFGGNQNVFQGFTTAFGKLGVLKLDDLDTTFIDMGLNALSTTEQILVLDACASSDELMDIIHTIPSLEAVHQRHLLTTELAPLVSSPHSKKRPKI